MRARWWMAVVVVIGLAVALQGCFQPTVPSLRVGIRITPEIAFGPVQIQGEVFLTETVTVMFQGGSAKLSLDGNGEGEIMVDDVIDLEIIRPGGSVINESIDFSANCSHPVAPLAPIEIGHWLGIGENTINFTFRDQCGGGSGNTEIWLVLDAAP